jgi:hypothetical protein
MISRLPHVRILAVATLMTAGGASSAAATLPHRITGSSACEQVQEVTISSTEQAAALRYWTPRRMAAAGSSGKSALARLIRDGARSRYRPKGLTTVIASVCGTSAQHAPYQAPVRTPTDSGASFAGYPSVGRLFFEVDGVVSESCTASVIDNSGKEQPKGGTMLILTAAHCVKGTLLREPYYSTDFSFVPDWRKGSGPFGNWAIKKYYIYKKWLECPLPPIDCHTDPMYDYAILIVASKNNVHVGAVTGANGWVEPVLKNVPHVRIVGYPASSDVPLLSLANTVIVPKDGIQYRRGRTPGFGDGTSGGPWFKSIQSGGVGTIIADTGGYQQGGDNPTPSYSDVWDTTFADLVDQAHKGE